MNQIRFQIKAGSAARLAEQENREDSAPPPRSMRIAGGTAARLAEQARRTEAASAPRAASISLRAQGGQVMRHDAFPAVPPSGADTSSTAQQETLSPVAPSLAPAPEPPRTDLLETVAGGIRTFFQSMLRSRTRP